MATGKLTPKQAAFVDEYLRDLNATQAAIRAGYSPTTANREASRLLSKVVIQEAVAAAKADRRARTLIDADRVVLELGRIAFSDPRKLYRPDGTLKAPCEWDDETAAAISGVETDETLVTADGAMTITSRTHRVKRCDKLGALRTLLDHVGVEGGEREFEQEE